MTTQPKAMVVPVPAPEDRDYWAGAKEGKLLIQKCGGCERLRNFPSMGCPHCGTMKWTWVQSAGRGKIYSWIVVHPPVLPAFADKVPYNVVLVELEEGTRIVSNLEGCPNDQIKIGMPVEVFFEKLTEEITLPKFRPAKSAR